MKYFKLLVLLSILFYSSIHSQENEPELFNTEITIFNYTSDTLEVMLHPVSAVFNGNNYYTLVAKAMIFSLNYNSYNYINGIHYKQPDVLERKNILPPNIASYPGWNSDLEPQGNSGSFGSFGYGMYKLVIKNLHTQRVDSCLMEFDYTGLQQSDLYFYIYDDTVTTNYRFYYWFNLGTNPPCEYIPINYDSLRGYLAVPWQPNSFIDTLHRRPKNFKPSDGFILKNFDTLSLKYNSDYFPLDSRFHCNYLNSSLGFYFVQNHTFPYPFEEPPVSFYDERHGIITLNLTIRKRVISPPYRSIFSVGNPNPTQIVINPGVTLKVLRNEPTDNPNQIYCYNGIALAKYFNDDAGNEIIIKGSSQEYLAGKLFLGNSNDPDSNCRIVVNKYCALKIEPTGILELGEKSEIDLDIYSADTLNKGKLLSYNNSNIITHPESKILIKQNGKFENYGANFSNSSNFHIDVLDGGIYSIKADNYEHIVSNGAYISIYDGTLEISNNSSLIFDGADSYCRISVNSNIILGENAKIDFKNGAELIANGSNFYASGSSTWQGLVFENSGQDTIINCTFSNAVLPVEIKNNNPDFYFIRKIIKGNKFNIPTTGFAGIKTNNALNLLIEADTISINSGNNDARGIYIINSYPADNYGNSESDPSNIIIVGNKITNGVNSIIISNNTTNLLPVYVGYNNCTGAKSISFIGRLMRGIIRGNTFDNQSISEAIGISINQSQPNLALNSISSNGNSIKLFSNSNPNLAPLIKDNTDLLWTGGGNVISSLSDNTIEFYQYSLAITDRGNNNFIKNSSLKKHLNGYLNIDSTSYNARYNCWNSGYIPEFNLVNIDSLPVTVIFQSPGYNCNQEIVQTDLQIDYWGAGIYDTTIISDYINSDTLGNDEIFFGQGTILNENSDYPNAIENFKSLINTYFSSQYAVSSIYSLYESYSGLDTSSVQSNRDILFGNLKTYLEQKIQSGNYDDEFNDNAFYMIVICEANMYNKQLAVDDYEFLSLYHPLPEIRVLASWDYTEMIALFGEGGSKREYNSDNEIKTEIKKISKRIEKRFAGDPVRNKILKSYQKRNEVKRYEELKINYELNRTKNGVNKELLQRKKDIEQIRLTENIAARNLLTLRNMDEAKKEEKRYDDLMLVSGVKKRIAEKSVIDNIAPERYELSQNYPNPFNPVTKINFSIPKQGFVTFKIYDVLGREVKVLLNEFKSAGNYIIEFESSNLASGIYFYKMEVNGFSVVKRMVILK